MDLFELNSAPITSATGIVVLLVMADAPFPLIYPFSVANAPVPPCEVVMIPFTLAAFPGILPDTFEPSIPTIFPLVTARSAILVLVILLSEMIGVPAVDPVPAKSPPNLTFP